MPGHPVLVRAWAGASLTLSQAPVQAEAPCARSCITYFMVYFYIDVSQRAALLACPVSAAAAELAPPALRRPANSFGWAADQLLVDAGPADALTPHVLQFTLFVFLNLTW